MIDWPVVVGGLLVAFLIVYSLTGGFEHWRRSFETETESSR